MAEVAVMVRDKYTAAADAGTTGRTPASDPGWEKHGAGERQGAEFC